MRRFITTAALAVAALAAAALPFAATVANASTGGCTKGVYAGYCGTQTDGEGTALSFDVYQQGARVGNKIIGYPNAATDKATDFFTFGYNGGPGKVFEYAPNGVASNLCISEPVQGGGLVLRTCNGSRWQQFTAAEAPSGFTWTNVETGDIVQANGHAGQLTGVVAPATLTSAQEWSFNG